MDRLRDRFGIGHSSCLLLLCAQFFYVWDYSHKDADMAARRFSKSCLFITN